MKKGTIGNLQLTCAILKENLTLFKLFLIYQYGICVKV